jgi:hypothetical protein
VTAREYVRQRSRVINNHLLVSEAKEDGPYCAECFERNGKLVKAPFDQRRNGWVCPSGHVGLNDGSGGRSPR